MWLPAGGQPLVHPRQPQGAPELAGGFESPQVASTTSPHLPHPLPLPPLSQTPLAHLPLPLPLPPPVLALMPLCHHPLWLPLLQAQWQWQTPGH